MAKKKKSSRNTPVVNLVRHRGKLVEESSLSKEARATRAAHSKLKSAQQAEVVARGKRAGTNKLTVGERVGRITRTAVEVAGIPSAVLGANEGRLIDMRPTEKRDTLLARQAAERKFVSAVQKEKATIKRNSSMALDKKRR